MTTKVNGYKYLQHLHSAEEVRFLKNLANNNIDTGSYLSGYYRNFNDFISSAFEWSSTNEGADYWLSIARRKIAIVSRGGEITTVKVSELGIKGILSAIFKK